MAAMTENRELGAIEIVLQHIGRQGLAADAYIGGFVCQAAWAGPI